MTRSGGAPSGRVVSASSGQGNESRGPFPGQHPPPGHGAAPVTNDADAAAVSMKPARSRPVLSPVAGRGPGPVSLSPSSGPRPPGWSPAAPGHAVAHRVVSGPSPPPATEPAASRVVVFMNDRG